MSWTKATAIWTLFTKVHKWWMDRKEKKARKKEINEYVDDREKQDKEAKEDGSTTTDEASGTGDEAGREARSKSGTTKKD